MGPWAPCAVCGQRAALMKHDFATMTRRWWIVAPLYFRADSANSVSIADFCSAKCSLEYMTNARGAATPAGNIDGRSGEQPVDDLGNGNEVVHASKVGVEQQECRETKRTTNFGTGPAL